MEVSVVSRVKPIRIGKNNIIICERLEIKEQLSALSRKIGADVADKRNEDVLERNIVYGFKYANTSKWSRVIVKFIRDDGIPVLELLDVSGNIDFHVNVMNVRKITDENIRDLASGEFKMLIYGVKPINDEHKFKLVFEGCVANEVVTGIIGLIERKENRINECYAGDLIYNFRGKAYSLREKLIDCKITYPAGVREPLNQMIFRKRFDEVMLFSGSQTIFVPDSCPLLNRLSLGQVLGEGTYGVVCEGYDAKSKQKVAIKIFKDFDRKKILAEANVLAELKNENVIQLLDVVETNGDMCLLFPLCPNSLDMEIYGHGYTYTPKRTNEVLIMILSGLDYIHALGVMHRDIKPNNLLVDFSGKIKICDFGLSTKSMISLENCGTRCYKAPEVFLRINYDSKIDIWAVGCISAEMFLRRPLFENYENRIENIFKVMGKPTAEVWPQYDWSNLGWFKQVGLESVLKRQDLVNAVKFFLVMSPESRPTAKEAITWLNDNPLH